MRKRNLRGRGERGGRCLQVQAAELEQSGHAGHTLEVQTAGPGVGSEGKRTLGVILQLIAFCMAGSLMRL